MFYKDGVKLDDNMRAITCPRCGNEEISSQATFCKVCGLELFNKCEGAPEYDNFGNFEGKGEQHINAGNARFCEYCGAETLFFKEKLLKPYNEYKEEKTFNPILTDADIPF